MTEFETLRLRDRDSEVEGTLVALATLLKPDPTPLAALDRPFVSTALLMDADNVGAERDT